MSTYKQPTALHMAWRAFWTILQARPHIYCDTHKYCFFGDYDEVDTALNRITKLYNRGVEQEIVLQEFRKILDTHENRT